MTKPRYAYLGPEGTFSELALRAMVSPEEAEDLPQVDVLTVLSAVRSGAADYAVVAIENTIEGGVTATLDALAEGSPLVILGETVIPIEFELVARPGTTVADISSVATHPHGWAQCRRWLNENLPGVVHAPAASNTSALADLADAKRSLASIGYDAVLAPPGAGEHHGLKTLRSGIADNSQTTTRFVRVGRPEAVPRATGADKTTLVVHLAEDRAGSLLEMLEQFAARGVNLSRIESRPIGERPGQYSFSIDALAHVEEERMAEALIGLRRTCPLVLFLGSYPAAIASGPTPLEAGTADVDFGAARAWVEAIRAGGSAD